MYTSRYNSSARILLKVSVLRPCHGVGRGQTIRGDKLGNAIGTQGGKGAGPGGTSQTSQEAKLQVIWTTVGGKMSDFDGLADTGNLISSESLNLLQLQVVFCHSSLSATITMDTCHCSKFA